MRMNRLLLAAFAVLSALSVLSLGGCAGTVRGKAPVAVYDFGQPVGLGSVAGSLQPLALGHHLRSLGAGYVHGRRLLQCRDGLIHRSSFRQPLHLAFDLHRRQRVQWIKARHRLRHHPWRLNVHLG